MQANNTMPVTVRKIKKGKKTYYQVRTPHKVHAKATTKEKAERQARLLRAVEHGWKPTGKSGRRSRVAKALGL